MKSCIVIEPLQLIPLSGSAVFLELARSFGLVFRLLMIPRLLNQRLNQPSRPSHGLFQIAPQDSRKWQLSRCECKKSGAAGRAELVISEGRGVRSCEGRGDLKMDMTGGRVKIQTRPDPAVASKPKCFYRDEGDEILGSSGTGKPETTSHKTHKMHKRKTF